MFTTTDFADDADRVTAAVISALPDGTPEYLVSVAVGSVTNMLGAYYANTLAHKVDLDDYIAATCHMFNRVLTEQLNEVKDDPHVSWDLH